ARARAGAHGWNGSRPSPGWRDGARKHSCLIRPCMTPGARIAAAIEILAAINEGERPADDIAAEYFRRRRYIGAKDRTQVSGHVYAVLRHRAALDWWIARVSQAEVQPENSMGARSRM